MMELNRSTKVSWDHILILSLLGIAAASWFAFFQPKPVVVTKKKAPITAASVHSVTAGIEDSAENAQERVVARTWDVSAEALASEILAKLTQVSKSTQLQITDFRAGRTLSAANLWQVSFSAVLEGSFMKVMAAVASLERPESKVAISQLKIVSKGKGDQVAATIGLTGFLRREGT